MEDRRPAANCDPYKASIPHRELNAAREKDGHPSSEYLGLPLFDTKGTSDPKIVSLKCWCFMVIFIPWDQIRIKSP